MAFIGNARMFAIVTSKPDALTIDPLHS